MFCCCQLLINSENEPREACKCSRIIRSWLEWMWRRASPLKINSRINAIAAKNSVGFSSVKKWKGFTNQRFRRDICPAYLANPVQLPDSTRCKLNGILTGKWGFKRPRTNGIYSAALTQCSAARVLGKDKPGIARVLGAISHQCAR